MWTAWGGKKSILGVFAILQDEALCAAPLTPPVLGGRGAGREGYTHPQLQPSPGSGGSNELGQWAGFISSVLEQGELPCKLLVLSAHISCLNIKTFSPLKTASSFIVSVCLLWMVSPRHPRRKYC